MRPVKNRAIWLRCAQRRSYSISEHFGAFLIRRQKSWRESCTISDLQSDSDLERRGGILFFFFLLLSYSHLQGRTKFYKQVRKNRISGCNPKREMNKPELKLCPTLHLLQLQHRLGLVTLLTALREVFAESRNLAQNSRLGSLHFLCFSLILARSLEVNPITGSSDCSTKCDSLSADSPSLSFLSTHFLGSTRPRPSMGTFIRTALGKRYKDGPKTVETKITESCPVHLNITSFEHHYFGTTFVQTKMPKVR